MKQFRAFLDKVIQTAGNGVLGTDQRDQWVDVTVAIRPAAALVYSGTDDPDYDPTLTTNRNVAASVVSNVTAAIRFRDANHHRGQLRAAPPSTT